MSYEIERRYPIHYGPIYDADGWYRGQAYGPLSTDGTILVKDNFYGSMKEIQLAPLMERGYQISLPLETPRGVGVPYLTYEQE